MNIQTVSENTPSDIIEAAYQIHAESQFSPWKLTTFADCFTAPYYGLLAFKNEQVIGYAIVLEVLDEATLMDIAVTSIERGKGSGKQLLNKVIELSFDHSMNEIWLEVRASNSNAIALYEANHFQHIETRKNYYPTPSGKEDAFIMKWSRP